MADVAPHKHMLRLIIITKTPKLSSLRSSLCSLNHQRAQSATSTQTALAQIAAQLFLSRSRVKLATKHL